MYTKEQLEKLGFKKDLDKETGIIDFVNKVSEKVHLVIRPIFKELFVWVLDEASTEDGIKIILDTSDLEQAIE